MIFIIFHTRVKNILLLKTYSEMNSDIYQNIIFGNYYFFKFQVSIKMINWSEMN